MERRSFSAYNSSSGDHYAGDELWNSPIQIAKEIQRLLGNGAISRNEIVECLPYPENEVIESLRFLQDEGFITACEDGIHYKNK